MRLLTAHRSKGLEWRLVVVAHVQAEAWPDLRRRSTLLQADFTDSTATGTMSGPLTDTDHGREATPTGPQGSHMLTSMLGATAWHSAMAACSA